MSLVYLSDGDLLDGRLQAIAIPVNTMGVPGAGLAASAAAAYPGWAMQYIAACRASKLTTERPVIHTNVGKPKFIISFATKREYYNPSRLEWIQSGLEWLSDNAPGLGVTELGLPMLGCGLGGLEWSAVRDLMEHYFHNHADLSVIAFGPPPA